MDCTDQSQSHKVALMKCAQSITGRQQVHLSSSCARCSSKLFIHLHEARDHSLDNQAGSFRGISAGNGLRSSCLPGISAASLGISAGIGFSNKSFVEFDHTAFILAATER